jgi:hypothetical protein
MRFLMVLLLAACEQQEFPEIEVPGAGEIQELEPGERVYTMEEAVADYTGRGAPVAPEDAAARRPGEGPLPHPRRARTPSAANENDGLCTAGEERWRWVPCESHGFPADYDQVCYYNANEDRMILPRCIINTCGEEFYSESLGTWSLPFGVRFRNCPAEMAGGDLDDVEVRRR